MHNINVRLYGDHPMPSSKKYAEIKPGLFMLTNLVEVQEHMFVPKLRAICLLDHVVETDYNLSAICCLASGQLSPLKKVKCKVGYWMPSSDESGNDDVHPPPNKQLRGLNLGELGGEVERMDSVKLVGVRDEGGGCAATDGAHKCTDQVSDLQLVLCTKSQKSGKLANKREENVVLAGTIHGWQFDTALSPVVETTNENGIPIILLSKFMPEVFLQKVDKHPEDDPAGECSIIINEVGIEGTSYAGDV
ncbi:hypothetical protein LXA43DRAFT_1066948 [Ganoderma leucocontextum]|nr:hypothetical protein LXA43DRAFT_1066948 [Ganoderma leucocontextum]